MELWELVAREAVRDLIARYNANGDSGRFDEVVALFARDAILDVDGEVYVGHAGIRSLFTDAAAKFADWPGAVVVRHFTATTQIDVVDVAHVRVRSYYAVVMNHGLDHWGRYLDDCALVDGRWLFTRRREVLDGKVPDGWAARGAGA
jgi:ketosteroid isomerase-like protein